MGKRPYVRAIIAFLLIPVACIVGAVIFISIDPEIARGHLNYARNYRLIELAKNIFFCAMLLAIIGLWFMTCFFLLQAKKQSYGWLPLALLGPFGLIALSTLRDKEPANGDSHRRFIGKLNVLACIAYELCVFVMAWVLAFAGMVLKRDLMILYQSAATGVSREEILRIQDASSGMYAFSEGLEIMFLVVLFYLLLPLCINAAARLPGLFSSRKKA
jgi:hypothetical protein